MWRNQLNDVGLLYSLVDDLKLFWQLKALEWDKLARKVKQMHEEDQRTLKRSDLPLEKRLEQILKNNEDYQPLRDRIIFQLKESLAVAEFLRFSKTEAMKQLAFSHPLPENQELEAAIAEAEGLASFAEYTSYSRHTIVALWHYLTDRPCSP